MLQRLSPARGLNSRLNAPTPELPIFPANLPLPCSPVMLSSNFIIPAAQGKKPWCPPSWLLDPWVILNSSLHLMRGHFSSPPSYCLGLRHSHLMLGYNHVSTCSPIPGSAPCSVFLTPLPDRPFTGSGQIIYSLSCLNPSSSLHPLTPCLCPSTLLATSLLLGTSGPLHFLFPLPAMLFPREPGG